MDVVTESMLTTRKLDGLHQQSKHQTGCKIIKKRKKQFGNLLNLLHLFTQFSCVMRHHYQHFSCAHLQFDLQIKTRNIIPNCDKLSFKWIIPGEYWRYWCLGLFLSACVPFGFITSVPPDRWTPSLHP